MVILKNLEIAILLSILIGSFALQSVCMLEEFPLFVVIRVEWMYYTYYTEHFP